MSFEIENKPLSKKRTKPNPLYSYDKKTLRELSSALANKSNPKRYAEAKKIIAKHMPYLDKNSNEFISSCRRIVRQYDKKHRRI